MSFYRGGYRGLGYGRYGAFGDVAEAQDAVSAAKSKVAGLTTQRKNQLQLIAFTVQAQKDCADKDAGTIIGNALSAGAVYAVCMAEQTTALGQRKGQLAQIELQLNTAKSELVEAQRILTEAKSNAASAPPEDLIPEVAYTAGSGGSGGSGGSSSARATSPSLLSNPLVLGGGALALVLGVVLMTRRSSSVGGYRRRRSR